MSMLRPLSILGFASLLAACSGAGGREADGSGTGRQQCGQFSALGQAVVSGAQNGSSTVSTVDAHFNDVVSGPIIGGKAFADAFTGLLRDAKHEVIIESFILADTWVAGRMRDAIAQMDASIPVYVLVTTDAPSVRFFKSDQAVADSVQQILDPNKSHNVIVAVWDSGGIANQVINHDKSIVVDREKVLVSNINMEPSADPLGTSSTAHDWYQMGVILQGEIGGIAASEATSAWTHADAISASQDSGKNTWAIPTMTAPGGHGCVPMVALGREAGDGESSSADMAFTALFTSAKTELRVQSPNLNDDGALAALIAATDSAEVYVVLSKGFTGWTESIPGQGGSNVDVVTERIPEMLKNSGNASHLHIRWYAGADNPKVALDGTDIDHQSHTKYASADSQVTVVGSQNMDTQSWKTSREFSVAIDDHATTQTFDTAFNDVWNRAACAYESTGCNGTAPICKLPKQ